MTSRGLPIERRIAAVLAEKAQSQDEVVFCAEVAPLVRRLAEELSKRYDGGAYGIDEAWDRALKAVEGNDVTG